VSRDLREDHEVQDIPSTKLPFGVQFEEQNRVLEDMKTFILKIRVIGKAPKSKPMAFQKAIYQTCTALQMLYEAIREEFPDDEVALLTYRINQDILERFFSLFRAAGSGHNTHPDPLEAKRRMKWLIFGRNVRSILKSKNTNVSQECSQDKHVSLACEVIFFFTYQLYKEQKISGI
jgi:hypothetical protein